MLASDTPPSRESHNYSTEDLDCMRQAFSCACSENPRAAETEAPRYKLAKAVVSIYQRHLTEAELVAAAIRLAQ